MCLYTNRNRVPWKIYISARRKTKAEYHLLCKTICNRIKCFILFKTLFSLQANYFWTSILNIILSSVWFRKHLIYEIIMLQPRNKEQEQEVINWITAVLGEPVPNGNYEDILKDGVVLCNLINKIAPGSVKKIQTKGTNFQLMENIQR